MQYRLLLPLCLALAITAPLQAAEKNSAKYKLGEKLPVAKAVPAPAYSDIGWEALIPKGWDPAAAFKNIKLDRLQDGDPRATEALDKLREIWDSAPAEPSLNGKKVRISAEHRKLAADGWPLPVQVDRLQDPRADPPPSSLTRRALPGSTARITSWLPADG